MRKQMLSLAAFVEQSVQMDPFDRSLYVFGNRKRDLVKCIYWDDSGFALWSKKLDQAKFPWPKTSDHKTWTMSAEEFKLFLRGIDFFKKHASLNYEKLTW